MREAHPRLFTMVRALFLLSIPFCAFSQTLEKQEAEKFVRDLVWRRDSLAYWFDQSGVRTARRLGIEYEGVEYKNLIGYDIDDSVRAMVRTRGLGHSMTIDSLDDGCALVTISYDGLQGSWRFYFKGNRCMSPLDYLTRGWKTFESDHFRFVVSDSSLFNPYCSGELEAFVHRMAEMLSFREEEMRTLKREKIYYYLCRDEDEIEKLTGFRTRGICNLAYDAVASVFPAHLHELTHLLVNFKLRSLPLFTHPFLQEGLAVAFGGRGGMAPGVLKSMGRFLYASGLADLPALLNKGEFEQLDASISYPASGLYNMFLIETRGMQSYLALYRRHSGAAGDRAAVQIDPDELASDPAWKLYLKKSTKAEVILLEDQTNHARSLYADTSASVSEDTNGYHFLLRDFLLLPPRGSLRGLRSKKFEEYFPGREYRGEKYLVRAKQDEISVYNLLTDDLIASYAAAFAMPPARVRLVEGKYAFSIWKGVFEEPLGPLLGEPNIKSDRH